MQSNSENSDFSGVDFAGIRALDPGGLYQVINLRNQEFIDHTFLGQVEIQDTLVVDVMPDRSTDAAPANGFVSNAHTNVIVQSLSTKSNPENVANVIVNQRKDNLAILTPISDNWNVRLEQSNDNRAMQTNSGQYNLTDSLNTLPPLTAIQPESNTSVPSSEEKNFKVLEESAKQEEKMKVELPHKKRIPRKKDTKGAKTLRSNPPQTPTRDSVIFPEVTEETSLKSQMEFICQLCSKKVSEQFAFFCHLKSHYDTRPKVRSIAIQVGEDPEKTDQSQETDEVIIKSEKDSERTLLRMDEEFSDPEDMLEGIRGVVDKVQEQSGEDDTQTDDNHDGLDIYGKDWYSQDSLNVPDGLEHHEANLQGVPENFVLYINKTDLEKHIETDNPIFSEQINQTAIEKALMETIPDLNKESEIEIKPTVVESSAEVSVRKTRSGRSTKNLNEKVPQVIPVKEKLRKRRPKATKESKVNAAAEEDGAEKEAKKPVKKTLKCDECQREFNSRNALRYHVLSHTGQRPHQCDVCGKSFYSSSALKVHKRLHTGVRPYSCKHCGRMFRQWGDLKYHITSKHSDEKNHQCEFCGKDFARRYSLVIHRRIHTGEKNYACDYCSKSFRASSYLQNHRKIHTGEKPYTCTICPKKFRVRGDMKRHLNTHYPKTDVKDKASKGKKKQKKNDSTEASQNAPPPALPTVPPEANLEQDGGLIKVELGSVTYEIHNLPSDEETAPSDHRAQTTSTDGAYANLCGELPHLRHKSAFEATFFPRN